MTHRCSNDQSSVTSNHTHEVREDGVELVKLVQLFPERDVTTVRSLVQEDHTTVVLDLTREGLTGHPVRVV